MEVKFQNMPAIAAKKEKKRKKKVISLPNLSTGQNITALNVSRHVIRPGNVGHDTNTIREK